MIAARADRLRNDDLILRTAARLLARDPAVTVATIAETAGLARLTVYRRYPDRDALLAGLRAAVDAELDGALAGLPGWEDGAAAVGALVTALAQVAVRHPVALLRRSPDAAGPPAADARVTALLREGQRRGYLRGDLAAETLHAALFGVLSNVLAGDPGLDPSLAPDPALAAQTVLTLLLPGITSQPTTQPTANLSEHQEGRR